MTATDGVAELLSALEAGRFGDCFAAAYHNTSARCRSPMLRACGA